MMDERSQINRSNNFHSDDEQFRLGSMRLSDNESAIITIPFKPFVKERNSTGRLMSKTQISTSHQVQKINIKQLTRETRYINELSSPRKLAFSFLKGQQKHTISTAKLNPKYEKTTTNLLGLSEAKKQMSAIQSLKTNLEFQRVLKLNLQADQGFLKEFRKNKIHSTHLHDYSSSFLATSREQHQSHSNTPGPGIYDQHKLHDTQPQGDLSIAKKTSYDEQVVATNTQCLTDFYDKTGALIKNQFYRIGSIMEFGKTQGRVEAYQFGIFARDEIQSREGKVRFKEELIDERQINSEIEAQRQHQLKYSKPYTVPKQYSLTVQTGKLPKPDIMHGQWHKMLETYGFKRRRGKLVKLGSE